MAGRPLLRDTAIAVAAFLVLMALPAVTGSSALRDFVIYVSAYGLLAQSLNLLTGYTGLVSFGHAAYFACGAYVFGLVMQAGHSVPVGIFSAIAASVLLALVVGAICVRLKDIYFAFLTLAFQMLLHSVILTWVSLTGGDQGLMGGIPRPPFLGIDLANSQTFYVFTCATFVLCVLFLRQITESPFGYTLRLIRDNQQRAEFLGVDVFRAKLLAFVLAGAVAGVGGILMALFVSGAYPAFAFWTTSGDAIFMLMLGGTHVFLGPVIGAIVLQTLEHLVTVYTSYKGLVLGLVILVAVLGLRRGIADYVYELYAARRSGKAVPVRAGDDVRTVSNPEGNRP